MATKKERPVVPTATVIGFEQRPAGPTLKLYGEDYDHGCRTLYVGDIVGVVGSVPAELWEVDGIDHKERVVMLIPFRHDKPSCLGWKPIGYTLTVVQRSYNSPTFRERRRYADQLARKHP